MADDLRPKSINMDDVNRRIKQQVRDAMQEIRHEMDLRAETQNKALMEQIAVLLRAQRSEGKELQEQREAAWEIKWKELQEPSRPEQIHEPAPQEDLESDDAQELNKETSWLTPFRDDDDVQLEEPKEAVAALFAQPEKLEDDFANKDDIRDASESSDEPPLPSRQSSESAYDEPQRSTTTQKFREVLDSGSQQQGDYLPHQLFADIPKTTTQPLLILEPFGARVGPSVFVAQGVFSQCVLVGISLETAEKVPKGWVARATSFKGGTDPTDIDSSEDTNQNLEGFRIRMVQSWPPMHAQTCGNSIDSIRSHDGLLYFMDKGYEFYGITGTLHSEFTGELIDNVVEKIRTQADMNSVFTPRLAKILEHDNSGNKASGFWGYGNYPTVPVTPTIGAIPSLVICGCEGIVTPVVLKEVHDWNPLETVLGTTLKTAKSWVEVATKIRGGGSLKEWT